MTFSKRVSHARPQPPTGKLFFWNQRTPDCITTWRSPCQNSRSILTKNVNCGRPSNWILISHRLKINWVLRLCCVSGSMRSEEHTSELQSRENLVCRLLLEKKKQ